MGKFSRLFPFIGDYFPPWGASGVVVPSSVGDDVTFTHELYRADSKHVLYLTTTQITVNSGAGGTVDVDGAVPEPQPGYVAWVYNFVGQQNDGANTRFASLQMRLTGNPPLLRTGGWQASEMTQMLLRPSTFTQLPVAMPIPRGNNVRFSVVSLGAGIDVFTRSHVVQIPVEAFDWQRFQSAMPNTIFNSPI